MKNQITRTLYCFLLATLFTSTLIGQNLEVEGQAKITDLPNNPNAQKLVTHETDGTLGTMSVASLPSPPPPIDTTRNLASDLELAKHMCECGTNIPPFLTESLLASGYTQEDLLTAGVPVQSLLAAGVSVQDLLNANELPIDLFYAGVTLDSLYGKTYEGGLIFYLDTNIGTGLVAAPTDQGLGGTNWAGCSADLPDVPNVNISPPSGLGAEIGDGFTNTTAILSAGNCPTAEAALLCTQFNGGGFSDWFLPSTGELNEMWENLADSDSDGINTGPSDPNNLGGFLDTFYWSSTEFSFYNAWIHSFYNGNQFDSLKGVIVYRVRAIRAF